MVRLGGASIDAGSPVRGARWGNFGIGHVPVAFALLALIGLSGRLWNLLWDPSRLPAAFSGPGDFPPAGVVSAVLDGQSVAAAYRSLNNPNTYPLPYDLMFVPVGLLHDPWLRPVVTLVGLALIVAAVLLLSARGHPANWLAVLSLPVLLLLLLPHLPSIVGLFGLCLAAWAQPRRRWALMGLGLVLGMIRPPNAVPLMAVLFYCSWGAWRGLAQAGAAAVLAMTPLAAWAFWVDPGWVQDFWVNLGGTVYAGLPLIAVSQGGATGLLVLLGLTTLGAVLIVRGQRGKPLDPDRAALVIALGILPSKLSGAYSGVYAMPALARLGRRPDLRWAPWIASGLVWVLEIALLPMFVASGGAPPAWESATAYWFVFAVWPLAAAAGAIAGGPPVEVTAAARD